MAKATTTTKETIEIGMSKETKQANPASATTKENGKVKSSNASEMKFTAASSGMDHNICQKTIFLNSRTTTTFLNKLTACCGTSTTVQVGCAIQFSKCVDSCC